MKFKGEAPGLCCSGRKVHLPVLRDPPELLHTLSSDSYTNQGCDIAVFDVTSADGIARNEVNQYEMRRYVSNNEAVWRVLNIPIHERHPRVIHLSVHFEKDKVYFTAGNAAE
ncbi:helitron_like_N domain-containing protein [Trichonephila clavata]|uniref:Helitron_like_N domain-containing protein n=1 Tax=Trichonephila clavata TaxID=2740835 RepID=A0A8X6LGJ0_TRICU|nr:helitron_like_N domain-containing protein [Trichonephila clavata]